MDSPQLYRGIGPVESLDSKMKSVLLVDDDPGVAELVKASALESGFQLVVCTNGEDGLRAVATSAFDAIILDLQLPGIGGMEICRRIRLSGCFTPVMIMSLRSDELDKVLGLELGADDYLVKPVGVRELAARLRALIRRSELTRIAAEASDSTEDDQVFTVGELTVNMTRRTVRLGDRAIELTAVEFDLLSILAYRPGCVVSREQLIEAVWGGASSELSSPLSTHMSRLRQKIEPDRDEPRYLLTVRGVGYKMPSRDEL